MDVYHLAGLLIAAIAAQGLQIRSVDCVYHRPDGAGCFLVLFWSAVSAFAWGYFGAAL